MIERIDEWEGRCAIEGPPVIQGGGDAHRRLVDIWDAKINFSHIVAVAMWCREWRAKDCCFNGWGLGRPVSTRPVRMALLVEQSTRRVLQRLGCMDVFIILSAVTKGDGNADGRWC